MTVSSISGVPPFENPSPSPLLGKENPPRTFGMRVKGHSAVRVKKGG